MVLRRRISSHKKALAIKLRLICYKIRIVATCQQYKKNQNVQIIRNRNKLPQLLNANIKIS